MLGSDVAAPCGVAWPWWKVHLRESVPLESMLAVYKRGVSLGSGIFVGAHEARCYYTLSFPVCDTRCGEVTSATSLRRAVLRCLAGMRVSAPLGEGKTAGVNAACRRRAG